MDIDYNVLKGKGLNIATPMYGGQCYGEYTRALSDVSQLCGKHSIRLQTSFLYNASLISAGRNILANNFLESDFDHLLFWDADVGVAYEQIFMLMNIQIECSNLDIVCGAYPKKVMDWERVDKAVKANIPPQKLINYSSPFSFWPTNNLTADNDLIIQVDAAPAGLMMIKRSALEKFTEFYPDDKYFDINGSERTAFFRDGICPETKRFMGEDFYFCMKAREAGLNIWLCPWMELTHTGTHTFTGSLSNFRELNSSVY